MSTPSESDNERSEATPPGIDLSKGPAAPEEPFDPYRFGRPDHPIPAEYAPPGYTGPVVPSAGPSPYGPPGPGAPPYAGGPQGNPFSNPPGTPYGPQHGPQYPPPYGGDPNQGRYPPPYGYGAPPPPPYSGYQQPQAGNGKAVAGLVFGILSVVLFWMSIFDGIFVVLGLVFALLGLADAGRRGGAGRGLAIAGLVCVAVGAVLAILMSVKIVGAINDCGGFNQSGSTSFQQCVQDHL